MHDTEITTELNWKPTQGRFNKTVTKINFFEKKKKPILDWLPG